MFKPTKPTLIWQMAKVGSASVRDATKQILNEMEIKPFLIDRKYYKPYYHLHVLDRDKSITLPFKQADISTTGFIRDNDQQICRKIVQYDKWPLITIIRDPLERNFSAWKTIKQYKGYFSDWYYNQEAIFLWHERQLVKYGRFNLLEHEFDKERGWSIYDGGDSKFSKVLVIQNEKLDSEFTSAASEFYEHPLKTKIGHINISQKKERPKISDALLDAMYNHTWTKHFYTDEAIKSFRANWK